MSYYLEDDDELRAMRERFMSSAPAPQYGGGGGNAFGAPPDELNPSHVAAFLQQRPAEQQRAPYPIPVREDDDFMRDNGFALLASGLDVAFNKGRGLGQIAQGQLAGEAARKQRSDQQFEGDRNAYMQQQRFEADREDAATRNAYQGAQIEHWGNLDRLAGGRLDQGQQRVGIQSDREARLGKQFEAQYGADAPEAVRTAEALVGMGLPEHLVQGRSLNELKTMMSALGREQQLQNAPRSAAAAAQQAGAVARAQIDPAVAKQAALMPGEVEQSRRVAEATLPSKVQLAGETTAARNEANAPAAAEGKRNKFRDETEKTRPQVVLAANLDAIMSKYPDGMDQPGVGFWDSWKSGKVAGDDDLAVRSMLRNMTDLVARVRSGAAIPPPEFEKIASFVGGQQNATEQEFRVAYNAYKNSLKEEIRQQAAGREAEALEVFGEYGGWTGIKAPISGKNPPRQPNGSPAAAGRVRVRAPDGQVGEVDEATAQRLGWPRVQ